MNPSRGVALIALAMLVFVTGFALRVAWEYVPTAQAQGEPDCKDYKSQAEAQADLRSDPSDPFGLDGPPGEPSEGTPGVACEVYQYPEGSLRDEIPVNLEQEGSPQIQREEALLLHLPHSLRRLPLRRRARLHLRHRDRNQPPPHRLKLKDHRTVLYHSCLTATAPKSSR